MVFISEDCKVLEIKSKRALFRENFKNSQYAILVSELESEMH